nr:hypothetical protein [Marinobacterium profundum]
MNIPCRVVYAALAVIYTASLFGLSKPIVVAVTAVAYMALALTKKH